VKPCRTALESASSEGPRIRVIRGAIVLCPLLVFRFVVAPKVGWNRAAVASPFEAVFDLGLARVGKAAKAASGTGFPNGALAPTTALRVAAMVPPEPTLGAHSITSSAVASSKGGTVRPSAREPLHQG
jgi:hypothetical protein